MSAVVTYVETLKICRRHADRLQWSIKELEECLPFTLESLDGLSDIQLAVLDQFASRFSRLQDTMGAKLFSAVLELTKEQGSLDAFVDKLHRLEKIGAIPSANDWLILREMRNAFSHEYPDDPEIQVAVLNKAFVLARELIATLTYLEIFANRYI